MKAPRPGNLLANKFEGAVPVSVETSRHGHVLVFQMDREAKRNRLDRALIARRSQP